MTVTLSHFQLVWRGEQSSRMWCEGGLSLYEEQKKRARFRKSALIGANNDWSIRTREGSLSCKDVHVYFIQRTNGSCFLEPVECRISMKAPFFLRYNFMPSIHRYSSASIHSYWCNKLHCHRGFLSKCFSFHHLQAFPDTPLWVCHNDAWLSTLKVLQSVGKMQSSTLQ